MEVCTVMAGHLRVMENLPLAKEKILDKSNSA